MRNAYQERMRQRYKPETLTVFNEPQSIETHQIAASQKQEKPALLQRAICGEKPNT
jgi:hypothetical protein